MNTRDEPNKWEWRDALLTAPPPPLVPSPPRDSSLDPDHRRAPAPAPAAPTVAVAPLTATTTAPFPSAAAPLTPPSLPPPPTRDGTPAEEITTVFIVGFPEDMTEREFQNLFLFAPGFQAATLKAPGPTSPNASAKLKQTIGFARFRTRNEALAARDGLHGRRIDSDRGAVLKTEMAKKNLHTKAQRAQPLAQPLSASGTLPPPPPPPPAVPPVPPHVRGFPAASAARYDEDRLGFGPSHSGLPSLSVSREPTRLPPSRAPHTSNLLYSSTGLDWDATEADDLAFDPGVGGVVRTGPVSAPPESGWGHNQFDDWLLHNHLNNAHQEWKRDAPSGHADWSEGRWSISGQGKSPPASLATRVGAFSPPPPLGGGPNPDPFLSPPMAQGPVGDYPFGMGAGLGHSSPPDLGRARAMGQTLGLPPIAAPIPSHGSILPGGETMSGLLSTPHIPPPVPVPRSRSTGPGGVGDHNPPGTTLFVGNLNCALQSPAVRTDTLGAGLSQVKDLEDALRTLFSSQKGYRALAFRVLTGRGDDGKDRDKDKEKEKGKDKDKDKDKNKDKVKDTDKDKVTAHHADKDKDPFTEKDSSDKAKEKTRDRDKHPPTSPRSSAGRSSPEDLSPSQGEPVCFVEFDSVSTATQARAHLNGHTVGGRIKSPGLRLSFSKNPLFRRHPHNHPHHISSQHHLHHHASRTYPSHH